VTVREQQEARAWIAARKRELKEQLMITPPAVPLWAAGKEEEEPTMNGANGHAALPSLHPSLAELQSAIVIVSELLTEKQYEPLRPVLATAALREIMRSAEKLIGELQHVGETGASRD
jgi:hypothetical protein